MINHSKEAIEAFFKELYKEEYNPTFHVYIGKNDVRVRVDQSYNYVELDFAVLKKISDFFGTLGVNTDMDYESGCETCDYGSSYSVEFIIYPYENNSKD